MIRRKILQNNFRYYQRSLYPRRNLCLQVRSTLKDNSIEVADTEQQENSQVLRRSKKREFKSIAEYDAFVTFKFF